VTLISPSLAAIPGPPVRVVVENPHDALLAVLPRLYEAPQRRPGIDPTARLGHGAHIPMDATVEPYAVVGDRVKLGQRVWIGAHAVIEPDVVIGDDVRVYPGVTLYTGSRIGDRVAIHAGARIGSDGFGYVFRDGAHRKMPHVGRCVIGDDVEIGANTTIDRGSIDDTVVGAGTKIDNLVHVGHNVRIGRLCLIMAQVGIAGSTRIEDGCILAGQVGLSGHNTIGTGARLGAQAGVFGDVPAGESWSGYPARPHKEALRAQAAMFKLPRLMRGIERLLAKSGESGERADSAVSSPGSERGPERAKPRERSAEILEGDA
jgi:UDP-3-O-[3-hydroxymyristoyl] glucosamine N-acyltransferase